MAENSTNKKLFLISMKPSDIISFKDLCREEGANLQRGMNFRTRNLLSVFLMNAWTGAPFADRVEEDGLVLIYEDRHASAGSSSPEPKKSDRPVTIPSGKKTQKGLFYDAAIKAKLEKLKPELVKIYEKITDNVWVYNGIFNLLDAWEERHGSSRIFKYRLDSVKVSKIGDAVKLEPDTCRIPSSLKRVVWKRYNGRCTQCGANNNLHFDRIVNSPKAGTMLTATSVQLLCARHDFAPPNAPCS